MLRFIEVAAIWMGMFTAAGGFIALLASLVFKKPDLKQWGWRASLAVMALTTVSLASRWIATGHPPVQGPYEHIMAAGWFFILVFLMLNRWYPGAKGLGVIILPVWTLIMGHVLTMPGLYPSGYAPLADPYKSPWLWIHVIFGWSAFGSYLVSAILGIVYLRKGRLKKPIDDEEILIPRLQTLDDLTLRMVLFGFVSQAIFVVAGAIWANQLWGSYWSWDPVETWALVSWMTYAVYLHLRVTLGWEGKKAAWLAVFSFISLFISFGGIAWMGGPHTPLITPPQ